MKLTKREELIWLSAFFEAVGAVHIIRNKAPKMKSGYQYAVRITVGYGYKAPLLRLQRVFGGILFARTPTNPRHNISFRWQCSARQAAEALQQMLPFLEVKREQAELAVEFQKLRVFGRRARSGTCSKLGSEDRRDQRLYEKMRELKLARY